VDGRNQVALVVSIGALVAVAATAIIDWRNFEHEKPSVRLSPQLVIDAHSCPTLKLVAVNEGGSAVSLASATFEWALDVYNTVQQTHAVTHYVGYFAPVSATGTPPSGIRTHDPIYVPAGGNAVYSTTFDSKSLSDFAPIRSSVLLVSVADYSGHKWSIYLPVFQLLDSGKGCRATRGTAGKK
jgi:hypothetical protein